MGDGTTTNHTSPVQIGTATNWVSVAAGIAYTVTLRSDGTLWAWGYNLSGQLGDGTTTDRNSPVQIGTATNWNGIAVGAYHTAALKSDGTLWAWGSNYFGELGDGTTTDRISPTAVATASPIVGLFRGGHSRHSILVGISRQTLCVTGSNDDGQLGIGSTTNALNYTCNLVLPCTVFATVKNGLWNDPTVWTCGTLPTTVAVVTLKHAITIPAAYLALSAVVRYDAGGKLTFGVGGRLKVSQ